LQMDGERVLLREGLSKTADEVTYLDLMIG